jgi:methylmalonyl-CoA mutase, N-terminal domain
LQAIERAKMFNKKLLDTCHRFNEEWKNNFTKRYSGTEFKLSTDSGVPLKPVYTPEDITDTDYEKIGMPGVYPFTRGAYPIQYQFQPPMSQHALGFGLPEHSRERYEAYRRSQPLRAKEREPAYFLAGDIPSNNGIDPDEPEARGRIGVCGVSLSTINDFEILFSGLPLDRLNTIFSLFESSSSALALYITYAEKCGYPKEKLHGLSVNEIFEQICCDHPSASAKDTLKLIVEHIKYCVRNLPYWTPFRISGYSFEEAGANVIQEMAFSMAFLIAIAEEYMNAGGSPDEFMPRINLFLGFGNDFFEQIAKVRALRRMWAATCKERLGCKNPRSWRPIIAMQTAGSTFTAQQPLNNLLRAGFQTLAASLVGADVIWTTPYDEAIGIHSEESSTLAFRTQQIIYHETNIPSVTDPLGGSYYVEWLTDELESRANRLLDKVGDIGFIRAWETGWFRSEVENTASRHQYKMENGEKIIVGVNEYVVAEEKGKIRTTAVDPRTEEIAIQRIKAFKANRNNKKTRDQLKKLKDAASVIKEKWPRGGDLVPAILDAAKADATMGEITQVIKEVFGFHKRFY